MSRPFSLATAFDAADHDRVATWVGDFLASRGSDNAVLAAALAQEPHWWAGPVRVPLDDLVPMAGPEEEGILHVEPDDWEHDVGEMEESIEEGWEPPPLIAEHREDGLHLQDGNHRFEALRRAGESHAWVIVWFDDEAARDRWAVAAGGPPARAGRPQSASAPAPAPASSRSTSTSPAGARLASHSS
ncbi:MAG TPA: ParB N-terminal domain-containing protein [Acidimicrobiales bacterium]|nr:ParB N-terminal domain-containing protein [Acidimicrobiales bacterium]